MRAVPKKIVYQGSAGYVIEISVIDVEGRTLTGISVLSAKDVSFPIGTQAMNVL